ncbi:GntR family transcriptional regulator [Bradyrhizobium erythrophlei]|uniref:GntR family transcriptional regulator n=1 Tax=Bradyrhizobium erythrophlei TaxID=1437360 RepID=UPI0035E89493
MSDDTTSQPRRAIPHKTIAGAVTDALRERILSGALLPGEQLRQDVLAEEFAVSRIPVREALLQLEASGLVKIMPHRGAIVSSLSVDEIADVFQLRTSLEPQLLLLSARKFTAQDYQELRSLKDEYSVALDHGRVAEWGELNRRFHLALLKHCGRPRSYAIVSSLLQDCDRPTRLQLSVSGDVARADMEHSEILELCSAREFDKAADLLRRHIENAGQSLIEIYRRSATAS